MSITTDILRAHIRPRRVMVRLLEWGRREDRAFAMLMGACAVYFVAQWPFYARRAHLQGIDLVDQVQNGVFGLLFVFPLLAYGIAALSRLIAMAVGGQGDGYGARLALFWAMLASTPLIVLCGMVKGFIGPGPEYTLVGGLWFAVFLWIWLASLWEAEHP